MNRALTKQRALLKAGILASAALAFAGCATPAPPIAIANIDQSAATSMRDLRPPHEKEAKVFSLVVTSAAYGIGRVGDDAIKPPPIRVLQHRTFERFGSQADPLSVNVYHFVIYRNLQSWGRRGALGAAIGGGLGAAVANSTVSQRSLGASQLVSPGTVTSVGADEWKLALFSHAEDPGPVISYVVYIDTEIRGKRRVTKTILPSQQDNINLAIPAAVEAAIAFHLDQHSK